MNRYPVLSILLIGIFPVHLSSCATITTEDTGYNGSPHHSEASLIAANLKAKLLRDPQLNGRAIQIDTTNGVVRLNGLVNSRYEAQRAEELARQMPGVVSVRNNLKVKARR